MRRSKHAAAATALAAWMAGAWMHGAVQADPPQVERAGRSPGLPAAPSETDRLAPGQQDAAEQNRGATPRERSARTWSQVGRATYYHDGLQGRRTSSGERYDRAGLTAAHRTLPLGTWVRVTNLFNRKSVTVRVNDRGPLGRGRAIDLSRAAASVLDYRTRGSAPVRIEVVRAQPEAARHPLSGNFPSSS